MNLFKKFNDLNINLKLQIGFFVIAFFSITVIGYLSYTKGKDSLEQESFNRLTAVREMKASQIEDYFSDIRNQIITFSEDHTVVDAMKEFKQGYDTLEHELNYSEDEFALASERLAQYYEVEFLPRLNKNVDISSHVEEHFPTSNASVLLQDLYIANNSNSVGKKHYLQTAGDGSSYSATHAKYHPILRSYLEKFEFYDIFLVDDETGHIIYSVYKEVDFGTSLLDGPYANSNIAEVYNGARKGREKDYVQLVDFKPYHPSYNAPASFIASPIYDGYDCLGVLIFQMPIQKINNIMTNRHEWAEVGLGESGETYIVADDYTLRNQSRFFIEDRANYFRMIQEIGTPETTVAQIKNFESTVGLQTVKTIGTEAALQGETATKIFDDYRGVSVLSSYKPLEIEGMNWVIMSEIDKDEAFSHVYDLRRNIIVVFFGLLIAIFFAAWFVSKQITKPIKVLTAKAEELASGNLDVHIDDDGNDEIGILSKSFNHMQHSIHDLVHNLEDKVQERTLALQTQKEMVEEKNREIVDSINYALRLQRAIIPTESKVKAALPGSFVFFKPKDIVSGDFYWMNEVDNTVLIGAIDCTGHGVPGAMVSVVGANGLNRCIKEFNLRKPNEILDQLTEIVKETFDSAEDKVKDGMDGALLSIDLASRKIQYSGANNPLWIARSDADEMEEIKANKQPIGDFDHAVPFTNHEVQLSEGDIVYVFSDGYVDQFGGPKGKKFKYKTLKTLLFDNKGKPVSEQKEILERTFTSWKGELEQLDDVCIIGIRV